jgi:hypothetical protein
MGVFARLIRRSKSTEDATAAEAPAESAPAPEEGAPEAGKAAAAADPAAVPAPEGDEAGGEGVEIPKQQSAGDVADSEAGESSRTK